MTQIPVQRDISPLSSVAINTDEIYIEFHKFINVAQGRMFKLPKWELKQLVQFVMSTNKPSHEICGIIG